MASALDTARASEDTAASDTSMFGAMFAEPAEEEPSPAAATAQAEQLNAAPNAHESCWELYRAVEALIERRLQMAAKASSASKPMCLCLCAMQPACDWIDTFCFEAVIMCMQTPFTLLLPINRLNIVLRPLK